jgi:hypothetical protein
VRFKVAAFPALTASERSYVAPGRYRFVLAAVASNARAQHYALMLDFQPPEAYDYPALRSAVTLELSPAVARHERSAAV